MADNKLQIRLRLIIITTDDPYIPITEPRYIHEKLNTEYHEFTNKGHFGWDTGLKEFPELIEAIKNKIN